jgi:uncharacterized lipoprotein YddW (UPF0748 family)
MKGRLLLPIAFVLILSPAAVCGRDTPPGSGLISSAPGQERFLVQWRGIRDPGILRGVWVTRWEYHDPGDIVGLMSEAADWGMTDVYFQVRGKGDAFYHSRLEPWASELTGRLGQDPGWDPLAIAVAEAHRRGLRLHAWINTFPMWNGTAPPPPSYPEHIFRAHPEWIVVNRSGVTQRLEDRFVYVSASPGNPAVQQHIASVVLDIVSSYAVDGVHFDYIRLPDENYSYDAVSRRRYLQESESSTYLEWQKNEITGMILRISESARTIDPGLILSATVVNRYDRAREIFAQEPADWVGPGGLDYVVAMAYTPFPALFAKMIAGYRAVLPDRCLVAGINLEEMPGDPTSVAAQVYTALSTQLLGHVFLNQGNLRMLAAGSSRNSDFYGYLEAAQGHPLAAPRPVRIDQTLPDETGNAGAELPRKIERLLPLVARAVNMAFIVVLRGFSA